MLLQGFTYLLYSGLAPLQGKMKQPLWAAESLTPLPLLPISGKFLLKFWKISQSVRDLARFWWDLTGNRHWLASPLAAERVVCCFFILLQAAKLDVSALTLLILPSLLQPAYTLHYLHRTVTCGLSVLMVHLPVDASFLPEWGPLRSTTVQRQAENQ